MPSNRRGILSQRVLALITDEWQDVEEIMDRAIPLVPPGRALRDYQSHADRNDAARARRIAEGRKMGVRKKPPTQAEAQRMGARRIVNAILGDMRDNFVIDVEVGESRNDRRVRRSDERRFAHHCCMHGGTCRGTRSEEEVPGSPDPAVQRPTNPPELGDDPLGTLIDRVLKSRREREAPPTPPYRFPEYRGIPGIREVKPGDIDRLLRECS